MTKILILVPAILTLASMPIVLQAAAWPETTETQCQILDQSLDPLYEVNLAYVAESRFEEYGESALLEIDADWSLAYFRNILKGDIDLDLDLGCSMFVNSADLQLPDQVVAVVIDTGWTWRYVDGRAFQLRVMPGIYSDFEEVDGDMFSMPLSGAMIKSFNPRLSGILGLQYRPGFERKVMPVVGVDWEMADYLRLEAGLPESRLAYFAGRDWTTYLGLDWRSTSFALREKGSFNRKQITLEDFRIYWGLTYRVSDELYVKGELGRAVSRSIQFKEVQEEDPNILDEIDIGSATFVRFGLTGPF